MKIDDAETNDFIVRSLNELWWRNNGVWIGLHDLHGEMHFQWAGVKPCQSYLVSVCLSVSVYMSICVFSVVCFLFVSLTVYILYVCMSACLCLTAVLFVCHLVCLSLCLSVSLSVCLSFCLCPSFCLLVFLSACLFFCLFACLSVLGSMSVSLSNFSKKQSFYCVQTSIGLSDRVVCGASRIPSTHEICTTPMSLDAGSSGSFVYRLRDTVGRTFAVTSTHSMDIHPIYPLRISTTITHSLSVFLSLLSDELLQASFALRNSC